jgi:hypothetical protein
VSLHPDDERMLDVAMEQPWGERFLSRISAPADLDSCWLWLGRCDRDGYGHFWLRRRPHGAHRLACELTHGSRDAAIVAMHAKCDRPQCVRPSHLRWGTAAENAADCAAKGRIARGERNPRSKLTETDVSEMRVRRSRGALLRVLAADYGVSTAAAFNAVTGKTWRHVTPANSNVAESA